MLGSRGRRLVELAVNTIDASSEQQVSSNTYKEVLSTTVEEPTRSIASEIESTPKTIDFTESQDVSIPHSSNAHVTAIEHKVMQNESDFTSGSDELYAPPESECEGSVDENSAQNVSLTYDHNISNQEEGTKSRKRKGQVKKNEWKRLKKSKLRLKGQSYVGFEKQEDGKYKQTKIKEAKSLGPRCNGHQKPKTIKGGPNQDFKCETISEDDRNLIHSYFRNLSSWEAKQVYVTGCVLQTRPKYRRKTTDAATSRKSTGFTFYLFIKENGEDVKKRVCRNMFLNTLSIGEKTVRPWILAGQPSTRQANEEHQNDIRGQKSDIMKNLEEFFNVVPKVESHYCRASCSKLFVEPLWSSLREMYRFYKEECQTKNKRACSWKTFYNTMKNMNLDLYVPKKDQCNTCAQYKMGTCDEQTFRQHEQKKILAREEKSRDKELSINNPNIQTYTVEAVLLAPRLNASANYYKTKLKVHNETFLNLTTKDAVCYIWHEAVAGIESVVFASIYTDFLQKEIEKRHPAKIIIWSDGCGYQNRNIKLANALLELSIKTKVIIEQKYLEVGHRFMEVDSIHSTIEKKLRNRKEVYTPADYIPIIQSARQRPSPYETIYCRTDNFYVFEPVYYKSIRPGNKVGDPCVNDVVSFQYSFDGIIRYKLSFLDEWAELPVRPRRLESEPDFSKLYTGPIPIEASKFKHLQELKELIPNDYRPFYENLLHK